MKEGKAETHQALADDHFGEPGGQRPNPDRSNPGFD
jgi:hypothetical protein